MIYIVRCRGMVIIEYNTTTQQVTFKEEIGMCRFIRGDALLLGEWLTECHKGNCKNLVLN